jgi:hypothetical protein
MLGLFHGLNVWIELFIDQGILTQALGFAGLSRRPESPLAVILILI